MNDTITACKICGHPLVFLKTVDHIGWKQFLGSKRTEPCLEVVNIAECRNCKRLYGFLKSSQSLEIIF